MKLNLPILKTLFAALLIFLFFNTAMSADLPASLPNMQGLPESILSDKESVKKYQQQYEDSGEPDIEEELLPAQETQVKEEAGAREKIFLKRMTSKPDPEKEGEEAGNGDRAVAGIGGKATPGLSQFGYELFKTKMLPKKQDEVGNIPVSDDYILGPGDQMTITLWGMTEGMYNVTISSSGEITIPKAGVLKVSGLRYSEIVPFLKQHLSKYYSQFNLSVSMGRLRTINIYVSGAVKTPGSYLVSPFSTVLDILIQSGGPTKDGTLRNIKVIRHQQPFADIDLYDFLLTGNKKPDQRLASGDIIFVPLIGNTAAITGEVQRPAIYETKGRTTISELISLAGGATPNAYLKKVMIERIEAHNKNVVIDLNLTDRQKGNGLVQDMDIVTLTNISDTVDGMVTLIGHVLRPGKYELKNGFRVKDIINNYSQLLPEAYMYYAEIIRYEPPLQTRKILAIDLEKAIHNDPANNLKLESGDELKVYSENYFKDKKTVSIAGAVKNPGTYVLYSNSTLQNLIRQAGGVTNDTFMERGELYRLIQSDQPEGGRRLVSFSPQEILGPKGGDFPLDPLDEVFLFGKSYFEGEQTVRIIGEVKNPTTVLGEDVIKSIATKSVTRKDDPKQNGKNEKGKTSDLQKDKKELVVVDGEDKKDNLEEILNPCKEEVIDTSKQEKIDSKNPQTGSAAAAALAMGMYQDKDGNLKPVPPGYAVPAEGQNNQSVGVKKEVICPKTTQYKYYYGMNLTDLVRQGGGLTENAYPERIEIHRQLDSNVTDYKKTILVANLISILTGQETDFPLKKNDTVVIYSKWTMNEVPRVIVDGAVKNKGEIELLQGMKIKDLIYRAGLDLNSYLYEAELTRYQVNYSAPEVVIKRLSVNIKKALDGNPEHNLLLQNGDRLLVKPIRELVAFKTIALEGEFKFPGVYTITIGERLSSVIKRAGGFTNSAYLKGAIFIRKTVKEREEEQLKEFMREQEKRLISYSASFSAAGMNPAEIQGEAADREIKKKELELIAAKKNLGRMVIHLKPVEELEFTPADLIIDEGDLLVVPPVPSEISVMGSVRNPVSFTYQHNLKAGDYIDMAGGFSKEADKKETYILKVDGTSIAFNKRAFLDPGDSIIIPPSVEAKYRALPLWKDIMSIVSSAAVTIVTIMAIF